MTVEKTNAQEREALAKIREILKDFDELIHSDEEG